MSTRTSLLLAALTLAMTPTFGCGNGKGTANGGGSNDSSREAIPAQDDPALILPGASRKLSDNITPADVGFIFGAADDAIPYPDTYWPFTSGGIDWNWSQTGSPLVKYMSLADPANLTTAETWEYSNLGPGVSGVQDWFGHCPGWTAAAMLNLPLKHAVDATVNTSGKVASCTPGSQGCVHFEIGDINALMAETNVDADNLFLGARCDVSPSNIQRDAYGRIQNAGTGCKGVNPGAMLVVLGYRMRGQGLPIAIDAQNPFNTDQIWNQPAYRYAVYDFEPITEAQAANLVATGSANGPYTQYLWNDAAKAFAFVDIGIQWVSENGPNTQFVSGAASAQETRMEAVIELDAPSSNPNANILGGEYIDNPAVGANRLSVAPFVWIANGPGPETPDSAQNGGHNPYVRPSVVQQLVSLAH